LAHIVEVLTGAETEKVRKFGHDQISTYGIGQEHTRAEWAAIGRELIRLGLARQDAARFNILELTEDGLDCLRTRRAVQLTKPMQAPAAKAPRSGSIACDEALFEELRALRKALADERGVPPYIVFSDVSLRQMARLYPQTPAELRRVSGVGEAKLRDFGAAFLNAIDTFLQTHPRQAFADDSFAPVGEGARPGSRPRRA
jgi:ATP-dependent DNA helicase RecQ